MNENFVINYKCNKHFRINSCLQMNYIVYIKDDSHAYSELLQLVMFGKHVVRRNLTERTRVTIDMTTNGIKFMNILGWRQLAFYTC